MQRFTNLRGVLKKKARIYVWLLVYLVPAWVCGLIEGFDEPRPICLMICGIALVVSLWIVIRRWEAVEQRKMARRVRILLLTIALCVGFGVSAIFIEWCADIGSGMYLPIVLSSAPLSAVLAIVRLGSDSASALGQVCDTLQMLDVWVILCGTAAVWGAMALLAAAPLTRRRTRLFVAMILSHYVVGVMAVALMTAGDWECLNDVWHAAPKALAGWALVYGGAHVLLWTVFLRNRFEKDGARAVSSPRVSQDYRHTGPDCPPVIAASSDVPVACGTGSGGEKGAAGGGPVGSPSAPVR